MLNLIAQHQVIATILAMFALNAFISGMPSPDDKSGKGYRWLFNSAHLFMGNVARLAVTMAPNSKLGQFFENGNGSPKPPQV